MAPSPAVLDVTEETFERDVIERSKQVPVVVDFWADWCGPCRTLSPILERLADEANGEWVLAKVDVDANPGLSSAFKVQGIPAVHAFKDGREVDRFVGALPEQHVRMFLAGLGPTEGELAVEEGRAAEERGDPRAARDAYGRAIRHEPGNADAKAGLERVELAMRTESADEDALRDRLGRDPADLDAITALADIEFARGDVDAAVDRLVAAVGAFDGVEREGARKHLVRLLDTLPPDDEGALRARRALAAALF
jgi:putative thioredoxin